MKRCGNIAIEFDTEIKKARVANDEEDTYIVPDVDHDPSPVHRSHSQLSNINVEHGTPVNKTKLKTIGPFVIGQKLGSSPMSSIVQCLARIPNDASDKFYVIKVLTLPEDSSDNTKDDFQGKSMIHTEYSLLSLLENQEGVIQCHGLYKDVALEELEVEDEFGKPKLVYSGKIKQRISLVLDCLHPHDYSPESKHHVNLQKYVIQEKQLAEKTALKIFYHIVRVVDDIHKKNIVHRDLKLGNMILNRVTKKVTLTNFCFGHHLLNDGDLLNDQRGSPAYISPDVLSGNPYEGKPSDIWSLGVVLYTMVYGQFPFYDPDPRSLLLKIKNGFRNTFPDNVKVSPATRKLISKILTQNPKTRLTSSQVLDDVKNIIGFRTKSELFQNLQVVPDLESEQKLRLKFKTVVNRLEALKHFTRRPANSSNVFLTSLSTSSRSNYVSANPPETSPRQAEVMGPPRMPSRITFARVNTDQRTSSNQDFEQLTHRIFNLDQQETDHSTELNRRGSL